MIGTPGHPLEPIRRADADFFSKVNDARTYTFREGALDVRTKFLIAMALDAAHGAAGGVASLAKQALENGATKEQIMEALQVANFIAGVGCVYSAAAGLADIL